MSSGEIAGVLQFPMAVAQGQPGSGGRGPPRGWSTPRCGWVEIRDAAPAGSQRLAQCGSARCRAFAQVVDQHFQGVTGSAVLPAIQRCTQAFAGGDGSRTGQQLVQKLIFLSIMIPDGRCNIVAVCRSETDARVLQQWLARPWLRRSRARSGPSVRPGQRA